MSTTEKVSSAANGAARVSHDYVGLINAAVDIASARLLSLIAVVGAVAMFSYAVIDPNPVRSYTVAAYAGVVLWPLIWAMSKNH